MIKEEIEEMTLEPTFEMEQKPVIEVLLQVPQGSATIPGKSN